MPRLDPLVRGGARYAVEPRQARQQLRVARVVVALEPQAREEDALGIGRRPATSSRRRRRCMAAESTLAPLPGRARGRRSVLNLPPNRGRPGTISCSFWAWPRESPCSSSAGRRVAGPPGRRRPRAAPSSSRCSLAATLAGAPYTLWRVLEDIRATAPVTPRARRVRRRRDEAHRRRARPTARGADPARETYYVARRARRLRRDPAVARALARLRARAAQPDDATPEAADWIVTWGAPPGRARPARRSDRGSSAATGCRRTSRSTSLEPPRDTRPARPCARQRLRRSPRAAACCALVGLHPATQRPAVVARRRLRRRGRRSRRPRLGLLVVRRSRSCGGSSSLLCLGLWGIGLLARRRGLRAPLQHNVRPAAVGCESLSPRRRPSRSRSSRSTSPCSRSGRTTPGRSGPSRRTSIVQLRRPRPGVPRRPRRSSMPSYPLVVPVLELVAMRFCGLADRARAAPARPRSSSPSRPRSSRSSATASGRCSSGRSCSRVALAPSLQVQTASTVADMTLAVFFALAGAAGWRWVETRGARDTSGSRACSRAAAVGTQGRGRLVFVALLFVALRGSLYAAGRVAGCSASAAGAAG